MLPNKGRPRDYIDRGLSDKLSEIQLLGVSNYRRVDENIVTPVDRSAAYTTSLHLSVSIALFSHTLPCSLTAKSLLVSSYSFGYYKNYRYLWATAISFNKIEFNSDNSEECITNCEDMLMRTSLPVKICVGSYQIHEAVYRGNSKSIYKI